MVDTTTLIVQSLDHIYRRYFGKVLPEEEIRALIGTPLRKQIRIFGELETFGVDEATITADCIRYYETHRELEHVLEDVTALLIEGKKRGLPTALVTSKNREELANTLPRLGIADWVDYAVTADDVTHPKPDPEGLRLALTQLGIGIERAGEALYIGDTIHDMRAARDAGVRGVGVTWGAATPEQLKAESPAFLCTTPEELRRILFPAN